MERSLCHIHIMRYVEMNPPWRPRATRGIFHHHNPSNCGLSSGAGINHDHSRSIQGETAMVNPFPGASIPVVSGNEPLASHLPL